MIQIHREGGRGEKDMERVRQRKRKRETVREIERGEGRDRE